MRKYIPLVLFIFSWPVLCADIHGRVVRVLDGDTIEVMDSRKAVRIRLVNIDAPEKKQDYGRWSTDMMKSLVAGKTVTVTYFQRDRYGRILGQVYAPDGMNVNQFMVRAGAGFAPIFPDICYHLTHYKPAAADIPVASDNPAHYADAIRYNARTPLQGSLLPLTRLVWA